MTRGKGKHQKVTRRDNLLREGAHDGTLCKEQGTEPRPQSETSGTLEELDEPSSREGISEMAAHGKATLTLDVKVDARVTISYDTEDVLAKVNVAALIGDGTIVPKAVTLDAFLNEAELERLRDDAERALRAMKASSMAARGDKRGNPRLDHLRASA